jgi:hypothetical protein
MLHPLMSNPIPAAAEFLPAALVLKNTKKRKNETPPHPAHKIHFQCFVCQMLFFGQ